MCCTVMKIVPEHLFSGAYRDLQHELANSIVSYKEVAFPFHTVIPNSYPIHKAKFLSLHSFLAVFLDLKLPLPAVKELNITSIILAGIPLWTLNIVNSVNYIFWPCNSSGVDKQQFYIFHVSF